MSIDTSNKRNRLLQSEQQGKLFFSAYLQKKGYSNQLLKRYRSSGWLESLSKGVMYRTGGQLRSFGAIASYNEQMGKCLHVGAHSALELSGFSHFVPMGRPLLMVGHPVSEVPPNWLRTKPQFFNRIEEGFEIAIAAPEQAFLECLLLTPTHYTYMDLYYIMEQLTTLRPEVLQSMLENTDNLKVKRMFLYMAQKAGHYWFEMLDKSKIYLGTSKYQLSKNGVYIPEYKITVPKELYDYE